MRSLLEMTVNQARIIADSQDIKSDASKKRRIINIWKTNMKDAESNPDTRILALLLENFLSFKLVDEDITSEELVNYMAKTILLTIES